MTRVLAVISAFAIVVIVATLVRYLVMRALVRRTPGDVLNPAELSRIVNRHEKSRLGED